MKSATHALPSIRARLAGALLILSAGWAILASAAVWLAVRHEVDELLDDTLIASAEVLAGLLTQPASHLKAGVDTAASTPASGNHPRYAWQWLAADGSVLARSALAPSTAWTFPPRPGFGHSKPDAAAWRLYGHRLPDGSVLFVGQTRMERREARADVVLSVTASALLVGAGLALWLRRRIRHELQPLTDLSAAMSGHDPLAEATLPDPQRQELQPLSDAINALGHGLRRRLAQERAVAAQVAHALRTPLAGLDAQLAAAQVAPADRRQAALQRARDASRQLRRVVHAVISLYRSAATPQRQHVNLSALLEELPLEGLHVRCPPDATVWADPDLLAAALSNLLDNAHRHGAHRIELSLHIEPHTQALILQDDGPGLPADQRERLQKALDDQNPQAHGGLGLMLADAVARAHGGRLHLLPSPSGFALRMSLGPPAAHDPP